MTARVLTEGIRMDLAPITTDDSGSPLLRLADEEGAQAVEYAMIGGLGAGAIGLLWGILTRTGLFDRIVESLLSSLVELVTSWF